MGPPGFLLITLFAVFYYLPLAVGVADVAVSSCNCDHCNITEVIGLEGDEKKNDTVTNGNIWDKEDFDEDGDPTICASDRDHEDRTFSSICHMHCLNKCTRFRVTSHVVNKEKKYIITLYRPSYYKLRDGPC